MLHPAWLDPSDGFGLKSCTAASWNENIAAVDVGRQFQSFSYSFTLSSNELGPTVDL
jgi:hypothetical protein